jgi:acid phosphatase type 7
MPLVFLPRRARLLVVLALACLVVSCGGSEIGSANPSAPSPLANLVLTVSSQPAVLVGAGDIAKCDMDSAEKTAKLLDGISGTVFVAGDNAYMDGSASDYRDCYHPNWGRHRDRTRPVPGNHEYQTPNASGYFGYFGASAGPVGLGYYRYTLGSWLVLALNSEVPSGEGSAQLRWVRDQLASDPHTCTAVYWHRPLFSSGRNGPNADMRDLWRVLYDMDVEIVINGHDHLYERFAPQTPDGRPDPIKGIRQFTVGTGGAMTLQRGRLTVRSWPASGALDRSPCRTIVTAGPSFRSRVRRSEIRARGHATRAKYVVSAFRRTARTVRPAAARARRTLSLPR